MFEDFFDDEMGDEFDVEDFEDDDENVLVFGDDFFGLDFDLDVYDFDEGVGYSKVMFFEDEDDFDVEEKFIVVNIEGFLRKFDC